MEKIEQFYRQSVDERRKLLLNIIKDLDAFDDIKLDQTIANHMIENYYDSYSLPIGLATNFMINDKIYHIPMANEEPSVIAAASNGAKRLGNITTHSQPREMIGQIILIDLEDIATAQQKIIDNYEKILAEAKALSTSMVKRGGGPTRIWCQIYEDYLTVYFGFNPCDAMGANALNTLLENMSETLETLTEGKSLLNILSNYQETSLTVAEASIPVSSLAQEEEKSLHIARRIVQAHHYATLDVYRATTNNKGIMNGIGAVLIATGNDWRAVDAGIHAFASRTGSYQPLAKWWIEKNQLKGKIEIPLQIATVGGTIGVHSDAQRSLQILGVSSANELGEIMAAVGLAQNFAALRAIVTEGIQKGHMALHAKQLALQVGASNEERPILIKQLQQQKNVTQSVAEKLLKEIRSRKP